MLTCPRRSPGPWTGCWAGAWSARASSGRPIRRAGGAGCRVRWGSGRGFRLLGRGRGGIGRPGLSPGITRRLIQAAERHRASRPGAAGADAASLDAIRPGAFARVSLRGEEASPGVNDAAVVGRVLREYHARGIDPAALRRVGGAVAERHRHLPGPSGRRRAVGGAGLPGGRAGARPRQRFPGDHAGLAAVPGGTLDCLEAAGYPAPRVMRTRSGRSGRDGRDVAHAGHHVRRGSRDPAFAGAAADAGGGAGQVACP